MTDTEKAALERRIDELCQENERLRADQAHWELGNCPSCPNIADLQEALEQNVKLRELCKTLYQLADESYVPFGSVNRWTNDFTKAICAMQELGIEVPS